MEQKKKRRIVAEVWHTPALAVPGAKPEKRCYSYAAARKEAEYLRKLWPGTTFTILGLRKGAFVPLED